MELREKNYYLLGKCLEVIRKYKVTNNKHIILVADCVKPRVQKISYALRKKGYYVSLLTDIKNKEKLGKLDRNNFDAISFFTGEEEVYSKCLLYKPLVYHIFAEARVMPWSEKLVQKRKLLGKIVYDQYDVYRGFMTEKLDAIAKREKYCLENADGLCCRMFETQYLKRKYNYIFSGKRILFFDYCWNISSSAQIQFKQGESLKFVYGGRILARNAAHSERYRIELNGFEYIAKTVQDNNAYIVIIPSNSCEDAAYSAYRNLRRKYSHLLLKEPMSFKKLICYEHHMDYGIDCVELESDIEALCNNENSFNVREKNHYYATNKYFDYLDAGIMPIYGRKGELFGNYLAHAGGAVRCSLEEMPDKMSELKKDRERNREKACKAREIFAIENQIDRLIAFYNEI